MLRFRFIRGAAALFCVAALAAAASSAQGFPAKRVRPMHTFKYSAGNQPYLENDRVLVRRFSVEVGPRGGMRIVGEILTDFQVEAGRGFPAGPIRNLEIEVALYQVESDGDDKLGDMIPGQRVVAKVSGTEDGGMDVDGAPVILGLAPFEMPELDKPLPPGTYRLQARCNFQTQSEDVKKAVKWVKDLWGARVEYGQKEIIDPDDPEKKRKIITEVELSRTWVWEDPKLHEAMYKEFLNSEVLVSQGTLFMGNVLDRGGLRITKDNVLCRDDSWRVFQQLQLYESQRKQVNDMMDADKKNNDLPADVRKRRENDNKNILASLDKLEARSGGKMDSRELSGYNAMQAAMSNIRKRIIEWEDDLAMKYWLLLDGELWYSWARVNRPGYNVYRAVDISNNKSDKEERIKKLDKLKEGNNRADRDAKREESWKWHPEAIKKIAFEYFKDSEEKPDFDSEKFTRAEGKSIVLEPAKWAAYRVAFLARFVPRSEEALKTVDVSQNYAIQKWGDAYKAALDAREAIIAHTFCYELTIRTFKIQDKKDRELLEAEIMKEWELEAGTQEEIKRLRPYWIAAKTSPSAMLARFELGIKTAKKIVWIDELASRYRLNKEGRPVPEPQRYKYK